MTPRRLGLNYRLFGSVYIVWRMAANTGKLVRKFWCAGVHFGDTWTGDVTINIRFDEELYP